MSTLRCGFYRRSFSAETLVRPGPAYKNIATADTAVNSNPDISNEYVHEGWESSFVRNMKTALNPVPSSIKIVNINITRRAESVFEI